MKYLASILGTLLLCFTLLGCGGGGMTTTQPEDDGGGPAGSSTIGWVGPDSISGDHRVTVDPGRLNVRTGLKEAALAEVVGRYGFEVRSTHGGWASLSLPAGTDLEAAARLLEREYAITSAEPVHRIHTARSSYVARDPRSVSFTPLDPFYSAQFRGFDGVTAEGDAVFSVFAGTALPMNIQGFNAAWDVALSDDVAVQPVTIAIIDAGWVDYSVENRLGLDETVLDAANSGFIADDGTFTPGLAAATWETFIDGDPPGVITPRREVGERIVGVLAARINDYTPWALDLDGSGDPAESDEIWNEGFAGINPNATYILIKTGELSGETWSFTDNHIAESIDHAVGAGANIIVLGMFGLGPVGANVSTALQNARDNDVLVIAPAGDVIDSFNGNEEPPFFDDTPVDITVDPVSPASDPNCLSVGCTGLGRQPELEDIEGVPNIGVGWDTVNYAPPFDEPFFTVTNYSNTGADIAAAAFGIGFGLHPGLIRSGAGEPEDHIPGDTYRTTVDSFGTIFATAYVAGAASQVFQTLSFVNGTPPSDDDVLSELLNTVQLPNLDGTNGGGLLNAGAALTSAINGGNLQTILPPMEFVLTPDWWSQPLDAVTRVTDLTVTPLVVEGDAPFALEINWGDGSGSVVVDPWVNGDPVTLTGGYETAGIKPVNIMVTDSNDRSANIDFSLRVINPLAASISITDASGAGVALSNLQAGTQYRFKANATNVYTGMVGDPPAQNTTTFNWYFEGLPSPLPNPLPAPDATGPSPIHSYISPGSPQLTLVIVDDFRPPAEFRVSLQVN